MRQPPPVYPVRLRWTVIAIGLAVAAACAADREPAPSTIASAGLQALIGDAACESDAQCRTVGVGAKACGGPESYLAWSTLRTEGDALQAAARRSAEVARKKAEVDGLLSTCSVVVDPGAMCVPVAGTAATVGAAPPTRACRLRQTAGGSGSRIY